MISCAAAEDAGRQRGCGIGGQIAFDLQSEAGALNLPPSHHRIDPVQTARGRVLSASASSIICKRRPPSVACVDRQFDHAGLARGSALLFDVFFQILDTPR